MELQSIRLTNEPPGHSFIICPCERSIVITLSTWPSSSHLPRPSSVHPFYLGLSSLFLWNFCLHLFWGIFRNTYATRSDVTKHNIIRIFENLPILSGMDVDTLQMHTHVKPLQILLTEYAAVPCVIRLPFTPVSSNRFDERACNSQMKLWDPTRVSMIRWPSESE